VPTVYGPIDLLKNELRQAAVQNLASAPSAPVKGQLWMDSSANILKWYDGTTWQSALGGAVSFGTILQEQTFGASKTDGVATTVARSDHGHGNPVHDSAAHSAIPLSALAAAVANINLGGNKITNLGTPSGTNDAATKLYVDNSVIGLTWKESVLVATTANIALTGGQTIDGVAVTGNGGSGSNRVLVKNQTNAVENGLYWANTGGAWARTDDANTSATMDSLAVFVMQGTTQGDTAWVMTTDFVNPGVTPVAFAQFAGAGTVTAGAGLTQSGNAINVIAGDTSLTVTADELHVNTSVIATVASLSAGYQPLDSDLTALAGLSTTGIPVRTGAGTAVIRSLQATSPIGIVNPDGVAGNPVISVATFSSGFPGVVPATGGATTTFLRADGTWTMPTGGATKYAGALTGTIAYATGEVVTHNLNTRDVSVTVLNGSSPYAVVEVDWEATSVNTITVRYNPNLGAGYRVVVLG